MELSQENIHPIEICEVYKTTDGGADIECV